MRIPEGLICKSLFPPAIWPVKNVLRLIHIFIIICNYLHSVCPALCFWGESTPSALHFSNKSRDKYVTKLWPPNKPQHKRNESALKPYPTPLFMPFYVQICVQFFVLSHSPPTVYDIKCVQLLPRGLTREEYWQSLSKIFYYIPLWFPYSPRLPFFLLAVRNISTRS